MCFKPLILLIFLLYPVESRIVDNCELAAAFANDGVPWVELASYLCIAHQATNYNSSYYINSDGVNIIYGMFKVYNLFFCKDEHFPESNRCELNCSDLIDDDILDDVKCAQIIKGDHPNGFGAWGPDYDKCKEIDMMNYTQDCEVLPGQWGPEIKSPSKGKLIELNMGEENAHIICTVDGIPLPIIKWIYDEDAFPDLTTFLDEGINLHLIFPKVSSETKGTFTCEAWNINGEERVQVNVEPVQRFPYLYLGLGLGAAFILISSGVIYFYLRHKDKVVFTQKEIKEFVRGKPELISNKEILVENSDYLPYKKKRFEVEEEEYEIDETEVLGSGVFGQVLQGTCKSTGELVAVKTVKKGADKMYIKALLSEIKIMIFIGTHPNIIGFRGALTKDLWKGKIFMFLEYSALGSLEKYLIDHRGFFLHLTTAGSGDGYARRPIQSEKCISSMDLLSWSIQIASGMEYLASKKVVHGDLAARNILLADKDIIKITDFGLSRKLYEYQYVKKDENQPLPYKWMALESLKDMTFSTQSDIWAFGVTLWEIFSLGDIPYPAADWSPTFTTQLEQGLRLQRPIYASFDIYNNLMLKCWEINPEMRPSFTQVYHQLREIISNGLPQEPI